MQLRSRFFLRILLLFLLVGLVIPACNFGVNDKTAQLLQGAIDELGRQPERWQETMKNTIDELGRVGTASAKEVLSEIQSVYNSALGQTESTVFCLADFIGRRVQQKLQAILHKLDSKAPEPTIVPVICSTNPSSQIGPGTTTVTYYGYDFLEFQRMNSFTADLETGSGQVVRSNIGYVNIPTNYQLVLDLRSIDYTHLGIDSNQGPKIVLKWGNVQVARDKGMQSELPILAAPPPPPPIVLTGARIHFNTTDENKDPDTKVTVGVKVGGDTVAIVSGTWGGWPDNSDSGWINLTVLNHTPKDALIGHGTIEMVEAPVGHDEWHFNWHLELIFSDGSVKRYDWAGGNVDYDRTIATQPL